MFSFTKEDNGKTLQCIVDPVHGDSVTTEEIINVECIYNFYNIPQKRFQNLCIHVAEAQRKFLLWKCLMPHYL